MRTLSKHPLNTDPPTTTGVSCNKLVISTLEGRDELNVLEPSTVTRLWLRVMLNTMLRHLPSLTPSSANKKT